MKKIIYLFFTFVCFIVFLPVPVKGIALNITNATTACFSGELTGYDVVYVNGSGVLRICPFTGVYGTGWLNISLGNLGNFTVASGGLVRGNGTGGKGGAIANGACAIQGDDGNTSAEGAAACTANGGGGGGGSDGGENGDSASGGGGGFGGAGGVGGKSAGSGTVGAGGVVYGNETLANLLMGSGGGGASGDGQNGDGREGGGGLKVNAGIGIISIQGQINMSGVEGKLADASDDSAGGGGSGGHVVLIAKTINLTSGKIYATGGNGGDGGVGSPSDSCGGGGGGGGRILYIYQTMDQAGGLNSTGFGQVGNSTDPGCSLTNATGFRPTNGTVGSIYFNQTTANWPDVYYPNFSNYWADNASLVAFGMGTFNVTIINTNGTVLLEINNTNITANNITSNVYNVSYNFTSEGFYPYRWHAWGNGTSHFYNVSETKGYKVNASSTCIYGGSGNWNLNCADNCPFSTTQTIGGGNNVTITGTGVLTFNSGGKWSFTGEKQYITIASGCTLNIEPGGGWNY